MKAVYSLLLAVLIILMLWVGIASLVDTDATFSESENRNLATMPKFTLGSFLSGGWFEDYLTYFQDTFPNREGLLENNRTLNNFYYFSALADDDDVQLIIDFSSNAAHGGEALDDPDATTESDPTDETTEDIPQITEPDSPAEDLGQAILVGNRAMDIPHFNSSCVTAYAEAVNAIADALGSSVRTFCIDVPNAAAFYAPSEYRTGNNDQKAMIDYCYERLNANVISVDAYSSLIRHTEEYIYFRTDHHWTQLGAYYAYIVFCEAAGFEAEPLDKFEMKSFSGFVGSMYTYLSSYPQASILHDEPDTLYYYRPWANLTTTYYEDGTLSKGYPTGTICSIREEVSNKYLTYLGGDHPITIIETDVEGPVCLMLKESYGNAFAPWLTSHYSKIIVVDPREFNRDGKPELDLVALAQSQGVNDCIVLNYPMMLSSEYYSVWLSRMVQ